MGKSLMLIESPNKQKTIGQYTKNLGIEIFATVGHIRELDEKTHSGLGYDEDTYEAKWRNDSKKVIKGKTIDVIAEINRLASGVDKIYLATDPDREGEAISWHIYSVLLPIYKSKCKRITFNEITEDAILAAIKKPRDIDRNQVNSYLARKILDRGLGFKLSDFSRNIVGGVSAGRVQSIALKFLKDKYEEIQAFVPRHWFNLIVFLEDGLELTLKTIDYPDELSFSNEANNGLINFAHEDQAKLFLEYLSPIYKLVEIGDAKIENQKPPKPLKTSTMHSVAINKLGFSSKKIEMLSQKLYEGVEIDGEPISLITYPRTDREDLSETFVELAKSWVENEFGNNYWKGQKDKKTPLNKLVQGAHEAIRPTYVYITPNSIEGKIDKDVLDLYRIIWNYAVGSLMSRAIYENTTYVFENKNSTFTSNHRVEKFGGFKDLFRKYLSLDQFVDEGLFKNLVVGGSYKVDEERTLVKRVDKKPPSPYTESSLIKTLESEGIGRPSTYSHIVDIVVKRNYSEKVDGKLMVTELGLSMSNVLEKYFPTIMQYDYTRNMEIELDNISEDKSDWKEFLRKVFDLFSKELDSAHAHALGSCDLCGGSLLVKFSKRTRSKFISCSNYPNCKFIKSTPVSESKKANSFKEELDEECPQCHSVLLKRKSKNGNFFVGCSNYPKCKYIKKEELSAEEEAESTNKKCPKCSSELMKKKSKYNREFYGCSNYPKCKYIENIVSPDDVLDEECPECKNRLIKTIGKWNKPYIRCENRECKYKRSIKNSE